MVDLLLPKCTSCICMKAVPTCNPGAYPGGGGGGGGTCTAVRPP